MHPSGVEPKLLPGAARIPRLLRFLMDCQRIIFYRVLAKNVGSMELGNIIVEKAAGVPNQAVLPPEKE